MFISPLVFGIAMSWLVAILFAVVSGDTNFKLRPGLFSLARCSGTAERVERL